MLRDEMHSKSLNRRDARSLVDQHRMIITAIVGQITRNLPNSVAAVLIENYANDKYFGVKLLSTENRAVFSHNCSNGIRVRFVIAWLVADNSHPKTVQEHVRKDRVRLQKLRLLFGSAWEAMDDAVRTLVSILYVGWLRK